MEKDVYGEEAWQSINKNFDHVKGNIFQKFQILAELRSKIKYKFV